MPGIRRFLIGVALAGVGVLLDPASVAARDDDPDLPRDPAVSAASPENPATSPEASAPSAATPVTSPVTNGPGEAGALAVPDLGSDLEAIDVFEPDWTESPSWDEVPGESDLPGVEEEAADAEPEPELEVTDAEVDVPELETPESEPLVDLEPANLEPLPSVSDQEALRVFVGSEPAALGPLSIGSPDGGLLFNPVAMPEGALWKIRNPHETFATAETIEFITSAIEAVEARHPGSPRLVIGDISRPDGGRLNRHRSHQAGRDADIGFYFRSGDAADFKRPGRNELDVPRTWTFVRALVTDTDIQRIFVDRAVQRVLYAHALAEGEDREWLDDIFGRRLTARTPSSSTSAATRTICTRASTTLRPRSAAAWPIPCSYRLGSCPAPPSPTAFARARPCPTLRGGTGPARGPSARPTGCAAPPSERAAAT